MLCIKRGELGYPCLVKAMVCTDTLSRGLQQGGVCKDDNEKPLGKSVICLVPDLWQRPSEWRVHYEEAHGAFFPERGKSVCVGPVFLVRYHTQSALEQVQLCFSLVQFSWIPLLFVMSLCTSLYRTRKFARLSCRGAPPTNCRLPSVACYSGRGLGLKLKSMWLRGRQNIRRRPKG